ncbi:MAG: DUF4386 domain-containing protein [Deltaproteobacteria bacterium]|nr:DUF4386 domain-containing protein [Deltaproteobacteria bacterium]
MTVHRSTIARRTGVAYLGVVLCGIFAEFFVRQSLVVPGDALATTRAIADSAGFFGLGIGADLLMVALDVGVAYGLWRLLAPVHRGLAVAATGFRLVQAATLAINLLNLSRALTLAGETGDDLSLASQVLASVETHALVYDLGLIPFGLACLMLGPLLHRAGGPRPIAWALSATGLVYLVGSFAALFAPSLSVAIDPFYGLAIVAEPSMAVWLIVRASRWDQRKKGMQRWATPSPVTQRSPLKV